MFLTTPISKNLVESNSITHEIEELQNRQKQILIWTGLLFGLLFLHMVIDPILHWSSK
ncbi:MAG: hypothetical protein ACW99A_11910 [Candidatus Kariarchaeaceae archaeon]|jgi:hypothetical protein